MDQEGRCLQEYKLSLRETYRQALKFYKENEGKIVPCHYEDKLKLVAYTQQVCHGSYSPEKVKPLGAFDVIGKDRRNAWNKLGDMTQNQAMFLFIQEVVHHLPSFKHHLEALVSCREENNASAKEISKEEALKEQQHQEERYRQIQDALNRQTFVQFKSYAEQQYPSSPDQQAVLIRQLQEQHYYQYMQQFYRQQKLSLDDVRESVAELNLNPKSSEEDGKEIAEHECSEDCGFCREEEISPATMWTRKEIDLFKDSIRREGEDAIIKVGQGETVIVRVPTHDDGGSALYWEFATDSYDIAFGLFFEWTKSEDEKQVSVHISDSEDEDIDEELLNESEPEKASTAALLDQGPPTSVIVPIYRRDCHEEVYAGSHNYPCPGVYLLKFDNTYSLWRSKTLYYRVYYTR